MYLDLYRRRRFNRFGLPIVTTYSSHIVFGHIWIRQRVPKKSKNQEVTSN